MTIHIEAKKNDMADTVLMPGDPLRAKWAAKKFLSNATGVNTVRGMLGYTAPGKEIRSQYMAREWECLLSRFM